MESYAAAAAKSLQACPTLCDPIDGSPPGSPVPGILQARTLEWVAIAFSVGSPIRFILSNSDCDAEVLIIFNYRLFLLSHGMMVIHFIKIHSHPFHYLYISFVVFNSFLLLSTVTP